MLLLIIVLCIQGCRDACAGIREPENSMQLDVFYPPNYCKLFLVRFCTKMLNDSVQNLQLSSHVSTQYVVYTKEGCSLYLPLGCPYYNVCLDNVSIHNTIPYSLELFHSPKGKFKYIVLKFSSPPQITN
jgi:hypothetical protein